MSGWVGALRRQRVVEDVLVERGRQEAHKRDGRFTHTCADPGAGAMTNAEKLAVLVEEVGEVAQEVLTQDGRRIARDTIGSRDALRSELVQVAAVAVAWIESLDAEAGAEDPAELKIGERASDSR